ncbi:MAG: beta-Ala-His dipeptidase, partial [Firmicutes bacterium]|nr:beta-Ala-His dipeptidase [Bacillota bacterium]
MFEGWKYQSIFEHFETICSIPHGSYNEKALSDYLYQFALEHGYEAVQDNALNVLVRMPSTPGREEEPSVILQGHMDMVCEKNQDVVHDFTADPIRLQLDGDWLKAAGTTLGGDNGIAIAYMMSIMTDPSISHPALELLMTVSEETGMDGAKQLDVTMLKSRRLINLDSEEEGVFIAGGAGGLKIELVHKLERSEVPQGFIPLEVKVTGLTGGHSGEDINKQRGNANVILGKYLLGWYNHCPNTRMVSLDGGSKDNAIPREATARFWIPANVFDQAQRGCWWFGEDLAKEYSQTEPHALITMRQGDPAAETGWEWKPMTATTTGEVINFLHLCPNGVRTMSSDLVGMVESSQNIAVLRTTEDQWT